MHGILSVLFATFHESIIISKLKLSKIEKFSIMFIVKRKGQLYHLVLGVFFPATSWAGLLQKLHFQMKLNLNSKEMNVCNFLKY